MSFNKKYVKPIFLFVCVFIFGLFIFGVCLTVVDGAYAYLNHLYPEKFPIYNTIRDADAFYRLERIKDVIAIFLSLVLINFIALRLDNKKYERLVILTDGEYLIRDGLKVYLKEFFLTDVVVSVVIPAILVIPAYFLSENTLSYFGLIFWNWLGYHMSPIFALFPAILISALFSFVGRMLSIPLCVRYWRSAWMTDI